MDTNDLNRRIRYVFMLDDIRVDELLSLTSFSADPEQIEAWRKRPDEEGYRECPTEAIDALLNSLIARNRGTRESAGKPLESEHHRVGSEGVVRNSSSNGLDNNMVLKQIRIALSLRADDVHRLIGVGGGNLGKSEVNALFRKSESRNFRRCGDQVLRWFLAGLSAQRESLKATSGNNL